MPGKYNFSDIGENGTDDKMAQGKGSNSGCYLSVAMGFVLAFLAILIAVGVGLIVHFAEKDSYDRDTSCSFSADSMAELLRQLQQGPATTVAPLPTTMTTMTTTQPPVPPGAYRLPTNLRPIYYDLELAPDFYGDDPSTFTFEGHVGIVFECITPTKTITLNANDLTIVKAGITVSGVSQGGGSLEVMDMELNSKLEMLHIMLKDELKTGETYRVEIRFSGPLTDDLVGLYLSSYKRGNETVYLATTQFEVPDAREAFPCFDEPAMKAQFNVTLLRKPPLVSLSNTKIVRTESRPNGWVADVYDTTPPMSTYLLAFIVCDFTNVNGTTPKGIEYRVWARPEQSDSVEYALHTGMTILDYYGDLFATDFPLQKQDMIAIPDFAAGAMENWGLITYRETALLYNPRGSSESDRQYVTLVIAHELAHQWFGNLVTLAWWDDLWLNEGFAEFVEYLGMDIVAPQWKVWEQFALKVVQLVFTDDQIVSSHPLYSPAETIDQMEQYFDSISYEKGASVIRMIRFCLGENTFRRALQRYLHDHRYSNANHTDLWNALSVQAQSESKSLDIADIMNTWTLQMGFPVVTVTRDFRGDVMVTQKRFLINPDAKDPGVFKSPYGYKWNIPLTMTSSERPDFNVTGDDVKWLSKTEQSKTMTPWISMPSSADADGWFLVNLHQYGYYRVNYHDSNWNALVNQLKKDHKVIPPINRAQIVDDAWNLASAGETSVAIALGTLEYLSEEEDYVPWGAANNLLKDLKTRLTGTSGFGALQRFIQDKTRPIFSKLGLDDTNATALQSYTRTEIASLACQSGLPECVQVAVSLFKQWRVNPDHNPISPSVRFRVYCTAVQEGDESDWLFVLTRLRQEKSPQEKSNLEDSLSCSSQPWILSTLLNMALEGGDIRRDDATGVIGYVAANDVGTALAWDFVRAKWDVIMSGFAQSSSRLRRMIMSIVSVFHSEFFRQQLLDFINSHPDLGSAAPVLDTALERVEFNIKWSQNSYQQVVQWLAARGYKEFEGAESVQKVTQKNLRLPTHLRPLHYDLAIEPNMYDPDPATFTFNGSVTLTFNCVQATNLIVLHINELQVDNIRVSGASTGQAAVPGYQGHVEDKDRQFVNITLDSTLTAGQNYTVSMDFTGPLDANGLDGLYLSSYQNASGTVYLATTQFEPTDARKAFPCMDEPAMKATFTVTVIRRTFNKALSNMPVEASSDLGEGRVADRFMMSKPMSTYLVAFIVCDFESKTKLTKRNITYEVWSRRDTVNQLDFALDFGVQIIDFYEDYFQVPFPLPKQAMVAIPDFAAGAMENWGLITYRETRILYEPGVSSMADKEASSITIAHELAHMWFGDLVSPLWWDELWLNEGFATFMSFLGVDHVYPGWKEFDLFVTNALHSGMRMDGMVSSHPVYVPVATPAEVLAIFDSISYDKGASIIRMIRHAIGEDTFKNGLTNYLNTLKYGNANRKDLWYALDKDGRNVNVGHVMDTWTLQMNYPVVKVTRAGQSLTLAQERFLIDPTAKDPGTYTSEFGYTWDIPFTYTTSVNPQFSVQHSNITWFMRDEQNKTVTANALQSDSWVLGNVNVYGYYRVNYDDDNWKKLATQLKMSPTVIDPVNRAQIIDDAWSLASGGYVNESVALEVVEYLHLEMDYVPWQAASGQMSRVSKMLASTELYGAFQMFLANKTSSQYGQLGMNNSGAELLESYLRTQIASLACSSGVQQCVQDALSLFQTWKQTPSTNPIAPELRSVVYCTAMAHGTVEDWNFLYQQFLNETNVNEKARLLSRLACSNEIWVLTKLLNRALYSSDIRSQDALTVVSAVLGNPTGTALAWNFFRNSWDVIFNRYRKDPFALKRLVGIFGTVFNTRIQLQELQAFVDTHPDLAAATRAFDAAIESTRSNIGWMDKNYDVIKTWLGGQGYEA
ncbi:hypothetical protein V1264_009931 [Littorina saxatilis]|uniref:glutamyl aminopeptidase n=1 Tax=Littorina saxatilis TaxID=31220 RepID=A0AAN9ANK1_9CAEN